LKNGALLQPPRSVRCLLTVIETSHSTELVAEDWILAMIARVTGSPICVTHVTSTSGVAESAGRQVYGWVANNRLKLAARGTLTAGRQAPAFARRSLAGR